jgi:hypothetical protein
MIMGVSSRQEKDRIFEKVYKETNYLKQLKSEKDVQVIENSGWNGPYLFTK